MLELTLRALSGGLDPEVVGQQVLDDLQRPVLALHHQDWDEPIAREPTKLLGEVLPRPTVTKIAVFRNLVAFRRQDSRLCEKVKEILTINRGSMRIFFAAQRQPM